MIQPEIAKAAHFELARHDLTAFAKLAMPWFEAPPHIQYLAGQLEELERNIGTSTPGIRRLSLNCPPGHGKSTLTQAFVAYLIGRNPARRVLAVSGNQALARRNSRAIRSIVQGPEWPFACKLVGESLEEWYTSDDGGVRAIGREGQLTGFRAEVILLDYVQPDAGTETSREDAEQWLREVMSTRLEPGGVVVMISTRWHEDDLVGRLQAGRNRKQWRFINLPALCVDPQSDPLNRCEGEALWPQRWPVESLEGRREETGSVGFTTQYQGSPVARCFCRRPRRGSMRYARSCSAFRAAGMTIA